MAYQAIDEHGIDVFSGTIVINWEEVKNDGIQMVYIKATEGLSYINPIMVAQYQGAKAAGLLVGFYHFAATNDPTAEYQHFIKTVGVLKQDLKPCLDYEIIINTDYGFIKEFMAQNSDLIIYAPHSIADHTGIAINKIWVPEPNTLPVTTRGYAGIQYSSVGTINGIYNDVSFDIFDTAVLNNITPPIPITPGNLIVYTAQKNLNIMLLAGLVKDGVIGPLTISKIKQFEQIEDITVDGIWGLECIKTTALIFAKPLCGLPYTEPVPTRLIQFRVGAAIDGIFGQITADKVKLWQKFNGLVADGIVGTLTWDKLLK
jgi:lysozyme